jgi:hypothetical protein
MPEHMQGLIKLQEAATDTDLSMTRRFIVFLGVYSGIINNPNFSKFVRYNAMQAVLLDVLLM